MPRDKRSSTARKSRGPANTEAEQAREVRSRFFIPVASVLLILTTLLVYSQTFRDEYVFYDDDWYVYDNPLIKVGISFKSLGWAITTFYYANWHPLTWITYLLDYQFFGLNPGAQHAVNVAFHLGSIVLLFLAFERMTRKPWCSALLAGVFALHPLHVESVAWVAERKDVACTFFLTLTLLLYARYAESPKLTRYLAMAAAFALSLSAKSMAVTFPFVLLLLDFWPLGRFKLLSWRADLKRLLWEKAPLLAMSAVTSVLTFLAQREFGAVATLKQMSIGSRLANVAVSYVAYIGKAFWPVDLAVLYPPRTPTAEAVLGSLLLLLAITVAAALAVQRHPYFLVGWLWYTGMLVPVIGLVQVGLQSMADRYMYMPLVGLSVAVIWTVDELVARSPFPPQAVVILALLALAALAAATYQQAGYWKNSTALFEHAMAVTTDNYVMENNLGVVLQRQGKHQEAIALYRSALIPNPDYAAAHANLGHELLQTGQFEESYTHVARSLELKANAPEPQADMGLLLAAKGQFQEAAIHFEKSVTLEPGNFTAQSNYCYVLQHLGRLDQAIAACQAALKLKPDFPDAHFNLGNIYVAKGQLDTAVAEFSRVLEVNPNDAGARKALDDARRARGH